MRNYAKATRGFSIERIFFDDDAASALPAIAQLKDLRVADGKVTLSMFKRSGDPELERYRRHARIGIVGETNETAFETTEALAVFGIADRDRALLPGMREGALG